MSWRRRREQGEGDATGADAAAAGSEDAATEGAEAPGPDGTDGADEAAWDRSRGPFDLSEVEEQEATAGVVDLGALRLPAVAGMELRLEVEEGSRRVVAATVALAGSTAQVQVFAAPRTAGIWDEVRAEIAESVTRQGGAAQEVRGSFGRELLARVPSRTPDGRTGHRPARFVGVDGPRWFLRAVLSGPAVALPQAAAPLEVLLRRIVVVRGSEAMAPRDLLTLTLPTSGVTAVGTAPGVVQGAPGPQPAPAAPPAPAPQQAPQQAPPQAPDAPPAPGAPEPLDRPGE